MQLFKFIDSVYPPSRNLFSSFFFQELTLTDFFQGPGRFCGFGAPPGGRRLHDRPWGSRSLEVPSGLRGGQWPCSACGPESPEAAGVSQSISDSKRSSQHRWDQGLSSLCEFLLRYDGFGWGGGLCDSADRHSPHGQGVVLQSPAWAHGPAACRARRGFHVTGREALVGLETVSVPHLVTEPVKAAFTSLQGRPCAHCLARLPDPSRGVA